MSRSITRISVLTSCTGSKVSSASAVAAEELYCGQHHLRLMRGVDEARRAGVRVDLSIVSAGHGVVPGRQRLLPYEQTFQGMRTEARRVLARGLGVPQDVRSVLGRAADLHVILLGDDYLSACELDSRLQPSAPVVLFCSAGTALRLPPMRGVHVVALTTDDTRRFRCGLVALKGEIGGRLLEYVAAVAAPVDQVLGHDILGRLAAVRRPLAATASTLF